MAVSEFASLASPVRCLTRAVKNARFLQERDPAHFALDPSAEGFGTGIPLEILETLHRLPLDASALTRHPQVAEFARQTRLPVPGPRARDASFSGTIHFAQITFQTPGRSFVFQTADLNQVISYAQRAARPISEYAGQYGANSIVISPTILGHTVRLSSTSYTRADLISWVNTIASDNHLPSNSCIFVVSPQGVSSRGVGGNSGYHDKANIPFIVAGVFATGLTLADSADVYAMVVSHEIAEMVVDPNVVSTDPEVCDPCDVNCSNLTRCYFDMFDGFLGSNQNSPPSGFTFAYYSCAIAKPAGASACPASASDCQYAPPVPTAVADPSGYALINNPTGIVEQHNLFRTADGHVHALWFNFNEGWHHEDRTALVLGTPPAVSNPVPYTFVNSPTGVVEQHHLFRTADGHIHALWFNFRSGWHHEDRTTIVPGVPTAVGLPFGYSFVNNPTGIVEQHNLFRSADGHVHALWFNFAQGWHHEDRTTIVPGTPPSAGSPFGYVFINPATGLLEQHNLFTTSDRHIHALWFNFQHGWHHEDRTRIVPGTPTTVTNPVGYTFIDSPTGIVEQHNLFRTADGHIHALWFNFAQGWHHEDRTIIVHGTPPAVGGPFGYSLVDSATGIVEQHNLFRTADGHIHALWFNFQQGWHHEDRTAIVPGTPPAVGDPFGYVFVNSDTGLVEQHNLFRTADGHVHALWFNFQHGWHHEDRTAFIR
jgi:hypothetical protein